MCLPHLLSDGSLSIVCAACSVVCVCWPSAVYALAICSLCIGHLLCMDWSYAVSTYLSCAVGVCVVYAVCVAHLPCVGLYICGCHLLSVCLSSSKCVFVNVGMSSVVCLVVICHASVSPLLCLCWLSAALGLLMCDVWVCHLLSLSSSSAVCVVYLLCMGLPSTVCVCLVCPVCGVSVVVCVGHLLCVD